MTEVASYDVCLSFAGEQREYAEKLADILSGRGVTVFYDAHETVDMWGENLYDHMVDIYRNRSRFCVLFASAAYARKVWTNLERSAAQDRALRSAEPYLLPVMFDDTELPGLVSAAGAVDARFVSPAEIAEMVLRKLERAADPIGVDAAVVVLAADERDDKLDRVLDIALERCGVVVHRDHRWSTYRRTVALVPATAASTTDVVTVLVPALEAAFLELGSAATGGRIRIGVHKGRVMPNRADHDVMITVDATCAAVVGDLLDAATKSRCAVVLTARVYDLVVVPGRGGSNPAAYRRMTLPDGSQVYVRLNGYPKPPPPGGGPGDPTGPAPTGSRNTYFHGPTRVGRIGDTNYFGSTSGDARRHQA